MLKPVPTLALLSFSLFVLCCPTYASDTPSLNTSTIKIALNEIPGLLESGQTDLPYNNALLALNSRVLESLSFSFHPASRAAANFNSHKTDCLFPGSISSNIFSNENKIESSPINTAKAYFISTEIINASDMVEDTLNRLTIGFRRGNTFGATIAKLQHHRLFPLNTNKQAAEMLKKGRIDLMLAYMPDSNALIENQQGAPLRYSEESLFYTQDDNILCHDNPKNRKFLTHINDTLGKMRESGELKTILGSAFIK